MPFSAGELDQRVTLQHEVFVEDGMGGGTHTWETFAVVWSKIRPMTGAERQDADRVESSANYAAVIRYRDDVDEGDILLWKGEPFNIRFVREVPRDRFLMLEIERGVSM